MRWQAAQRADDEEDDLSRRGLSNKRSRTKDGGWVQSRNVAEYIQQSRCVTVQVCQVAARVFLRCTKGDKETDSSGASITASGAVCRRQTQRNCTRWAFAEECWRALWACHVRALHVQARALAATEGQGTSGGSLSER